MNNLDELSYSIIGGCYEVYKELGYGFLEKVYENALVYELKNKGFEVEIQKEIKVNYKGICIGNYIADIIVNNKIILELKSIEKLNVIHEVQLVNYLKATGIEIGLLINFNPNKVEIKRKYKDRKWIIRKNKNRKRTFLTEWIWLTRKKTKK